MDLVREFIATEKPEIVRFVSGYREARDIYSALKTESLMKAILFMEYWRSYNFTGRVPEEMRRFA